MWRLFSKPPINRDDIYEPSPRVGSFTSASADELFLYGGRFENFLSRRNQLTKSVQVYDSVVEAWKEIPTAGKSPQGLFNGAAAYSNHFMYTYGGNDGTSLHASLHQLDTRLYKWNILASQQENGPMLKVGCCMMCYKDTLLLCCGYGTPSSETQPESQFIMDEPYVGCGWTNEIHSFNIQQGTWFSPIITGTRPPPCAFFTLTKISSTKAILFGGRTYAGRQNHLLILDLTTMNFTEVSFQGGEDTKPTGRSFHVAFCIGYGSEHPQLIIQGGLDNNNIVLNDLWCYNVNLRRWKEISVPHLQSRFRHSAATFAISPEITEVVLFGGSPEWPKKYKTDDDFVCLADTIILRFRNQDLNAPQSEAILTDIISKSQLGSGMRMKEKVTQLRMRERQLQQQLEKAGFTAPKTRIQQEEEETDLKATSKDGWQTGSDKETATRIQQFEKKVFLLEETIQNLEVNLERKSQEFEVASTRIEMAEQRTKDLEARLIVSEETVQTKSREVAVSSRRLQQMEARAQDLEERLLREQAIRAREDAKKICDSNNQWLVKRAEIHMTDEKLGGGGWGEVVVAEFRGMKVAAKVLFKQLQAPYYHNTFIREMNMASRVRHPNLVQFIGASLDEEKVILMELLPTSLRQHLENCGPAIPTRVFRISVSLDVARALNYLHLMQPQPIIHRDISSANVLLEPLSGQRWKAKVTDYGSVNLQNKIKTKTPGNPTYSAPEAFDPNLQSSSMDIFSFGVLLVEMNTAQFPEVDDREELIRTIREEHWMDIIQRCIVEDPMLRPSASQIITQLLEWQ